MLRGGACTLCTSGDDDRRRSGTRLGSRLTQRVEQAAAATGLMIAVERILVLPSSDEADSGTAAGLVDS